MRTYANAGTMATADPNKPIAGQTLDEAVDGILEGVTRLLVELAGETNRRFDNVEGRLQAIAEELSAVKEQMRASSAKFSPTPSRRESNGLKSGVDRISPL